MTTDTKVAELPAKWRAKAKRIRGITAGRYFAADIMESSADDLEAALARQSPSYEALDIIARSVCAALERAGVTECDDPGESIDVLVQDYERKLAALARQEADTAAPVGQVALFEMFSKLKTSGGCIVSSGDCGTMEIVDAQARGDFTADADGFGFVLRPHAWLQKHSRFASGANDSCEQQDAAPPAAQADTLSERMQQKCSDWGTYWRAPDAHGVILSVEQASELLRDVLLVEVEIKPTAQAVDQWLPIETAPKDGTMFLGWVSAERWSQVDGEGSGRCADTSEVDFCQWRENRGNGYFTNMMGQIGDAQDITHWMPLPVAPIDQQAGKAGSAA